MTWYQTLGASWPTAWPATNIAVYPNDDARATLHVCASAEVDARTDTVLERYVTVAGRVPECFEDLPGIEWSSHVQVHLSPGRARSLGRAILRLASGTSASARLGREWVTAVAPFTNDHHRNAVDLISMAQHPAGDPYMTVCMETPEFPTHPEPSSFIDTRVYLDLLTAQLVCEELFRVAASLEARRERCDNP